MKYIIIILVFLFTVTQPTFSQNIKLNISGKTGYFDGVWSTHNFSSKVNMVVFFDEGVIYLFETYSSSIVTFYSFESEDVTIIGKKKNKLYHFELSECMNCDNRVNSFDINLLNMQVSFNYGSYSEIHYISDYDFMTNSETNEYINSFYKKSQ